MIIYALCTCTMRMHAYLHMHVSNQMLDCAMYSDETSVCRLLHRLIEV